MMGKRGEGDDGEARGGRNGPLRECAKSATLEAMKRNARTASEQEPVQTLLDEGAAPSDSPAPDPYLAGFAEGRRSMARSIALKLRGSLPDDELASLVGLDAAGLEALLAPPDPAPERTRAAPVLHGLSLVEPAFVRMLRAARGLTQPELARLVGVHPDTVCDWETAPGPVRIKAASHRALVRLAAAPHA